METLSDAMGFAGESGTGGSMPRINRRSLAHGGSFTADDDDLTAFLLHPVTGGEPRSGQLTGTRALMLAVLEDGIRSYLGNSRVIAHEAEFWIHSHRRHSPFSFIVVCEMLGLDPDAVRKTLQRMKFDNVSPRKALPRARHNVRIPGRVYARKRP
jgi:hypothetical protein